MKKALFIVGPTAVGKTDLAFELYKKIPSELISADSIQVYRGADIISGKDRSCPTELLDILTPTSSFSVRDFVQHVRPIVKNTINSNKIPIVVGGTGFYIDALFGKIDTISIPPNQKLREEFSKMTVEQLQEKLKEVNPDRLKKMNNSDINNPRRLIRAIEVGLEVSTIEPVFFEDEVLTIGLKTSMDNLRKRITERVEKRIKMGALDEAKKLFKQYVELSEQIKSANGYRELFDYLLGATTLNEAIKSWIIADYQHAKSQMTYFSRNKNIHWFDIDDKGFENKILELVKTQT